MTRIKTILLLTGFFLAQSSTAQRQFETFEMVSGDTTFLMKKYFLCIYKSGDTRSENEEERMNIQKQHLAHITSLAEQDLVHLSGPLESDDENRGILILSVYSRKEAEDLIGKDPAVVAGRLDFAVYPLWAAKGSTLR